MGVCTPAPCGRAQQRSPPPRLHRRDSSCASVAEACLLCSGCGQNGPGIPAHRQDAGAERHPGRPQSLDCVRGGPGAPCSTLWSWHAMPVGPAAAWVAVPGRACAACNERALHAGTCSVTGGTQSALRCRHAPDWLCKLVKPCAQRRPWQACASNCTWQARVHRCLLQACGCR